MENRNKKTILSSYGAWAFSIGTSVGWGCLVVTNSSFLSVAGPLGSIIGLLIGMAVMLVIGRNYSYMMSVSPDAGGAYTYAKNSFGYDYGFLSSWFASLAYLAMLLANATSIPLFARYFLGDIFMWGHLYTAFGYDIYLGEALLSIAAIVINTIICARSRKLSFRIITAASTLFFFGITVCFLAAMFNMHRSGFTFQPYFVDDNAFNLKEIVQIAFISPWAFIGFENICHLSEEFSFKENSYFRVLLIAVITTALMYIFVFLLSVSTHPANYGSWLEFIRDLENLNGLAGLPAFYAATYYLGSTGTNILMVSLLALIISSLIGNTTALSRLFYALGKDEILPKQFGELDQNENPVKAIRLVLLIAFLIPFVGRMAIGWVVDVTTIGATMIYGLVSLSTYVTARNRNDRIEEKTGLFGIVAMVISLFYLLASNLFGMDTMASESYILFTIWGILGFAFFRMVLKRDANEKFGTTIVVWISLLMLILFTSLIWLGQSNADIAKMVITESKKYYLNPVSLKEDIFVTQLTEKARIMSSSRLLLVIFLFLASLAILISNYITLSRYAKENEEQLSLFRNRISVDTLTGVKSINAYREKEKEINELIAQGRMQDFALAICDVNNLKYINDTYGHKIGDDYIRNASSIICRIFKHSPVYRFGGDEFIILLTGDDYARRNKLLEEIRGLSLDNLAKDEIAIASGMADYDKENDKEVLEVFSKADDSMYQDKKKLKTIQRL